MSGRFSKYLAYRTESFNVSGITTTIKPDKVTATELDSHADSPVVGGYAKILEDTGKTVTVSGFTSALGKPLSVSVVNAAVAYDCELSGETRILVIYNALYFKDMEVNLIPPFMMRLAGIEVDECPKFLSKEPTESNHSMLFPEHGIRIPFHLEGIISYIPTRIPSDEELMKYEGEYLMLTPNIQSWNPHTVIYKNQEYEMTDYNGNVKSKLIRPNLENILISAGDSHSTFNNNLISSVRILGAISSVKTGHRKGRVTAEQLAQRLQIPLEMAKKTIQATTQLAVRSVSEPSLTRKFKSNDRMLRYKRLATDTFMDTMFASKKSGPSIRGFTACQVFATEFGHVFVVPLSSQ